jgi:hypothetical protein
MYDYNAIDCEQCSSDSVCCSCKNIAYYKLAQQLKAKEQECEELKNEYWKLEQGNDFLAEKNSKLKGCLIEIKEIAKNGCYDDCCMPLDELSIILQKISEVEDE